jgi:hypothetical protein
MVAKQLGAIWPSQNAGQVNNFNTGKGTGWLVAHDKSSLEPELSS